MSQGFVYGGYFVSEEAEQAAKWKIVENYNRAKAKLAVLEGELKEASADLSEMGRNTSRDYLLGSNTFLFSDKQVRIVNENAPSGRSANITEISLKYFNADLLVNLLKDFQNTRTEVKELKASLKAAGLEVGF